MEQLIDATGRVEVQTINCRSGEQASDPIAQLRWAGCPPGAR